MPDISVAKLLSIGYIVCRKSHTVWIVGIEKVIILSNYEIWNPCKLSLPLLLIPCIIPMLKVPLDCLVGFEKDYLCRLKPRRRTFILSEVTYRKWEVLRY